MAGIADIFAAVRLQLDEKGFEAQALRVGNRAGQSAGAKMSSQLNNKLKSALGGAVIGAAVAGGLQSATLAFGAFEQRMNEVFTLLPGLSRTAMGKMQEDVKAFARETGKTTEEVIPALYQAISSGVPPENVFDFLRTANKNAVGGVADLETSVNGLSSVVNAYGSDVLSAAQASDIMFTGVRLGKTTIGELSNSLFQVIPNAAALGVSFGDVTAALAAMTAQGVPTSVATTQLRQLFVELSKESSATSKTFKELSGKSFKEFIAAGGNVQDALIIMEKGAIDSGKAINDLFGSTEAGAAALALTGKGAATLTKNLDEMGASAGATEKAFEQMSQGGAFEAAKFAAKLETLAIDVGQVVSKFGPLPQIIASTFGPSMARAIGAGLGGLVGLVGPRLASALAGLLPTAVASGTAQGVAMGGAAAASTIATQTAGVATGQAAVAAGAVGPATAAGGTIGRAMALGISGALVIAIPLVVASVIAVLGDQFLEGVKKEIDENVTAAIAGGDATALAELEKELQGRIRSARASHVNEPLLRDLERQLARIQAARSPITQDMLAEHRAREQQDRSSGASGGGSAPDGPNEWTSGWSRGVDVLHEDLVKAIETIRTTDDPAKVGAAIAAVLSSILGGEGNAAQTTALVAELSAKRDAALARGDTATAQAFASAIAKIEPFAKGRQWQKEQLDAANRIYESNKTSAEKIAALKGIQQDLLSHNRTMAADLVAQLINVETAVVDVETAVKNIRAAQIAVGRGPTERDEGPSGPAPAPSKPKAFPAIPIVTKAAGGFFRPRQPMIVGELRPELLIPDVGGRIEPRVSEGGGGTTNYNVEIQGLLRARDPFEVATQLKRLGSFGVLTPRRAGA